MGQRRMFNGSFGRADLLCALVLHERVPHRGPDPHEAEAPDTAVLRTLSVSGGEAQAWCYGWQPASQKPPPEGPGPDDLPPPEPKISASFRAPLRMPLGWRAEVAPRPPEDLEVEPEGEAHESSAVAPEPLPRATQAQAFALQDHLGSPLSAHQARAHLRRAVCGVPPGAGRVDWLAVVEQVARHAPLLKWPRAARPRWPGQLQVVVDGQSLSMRPFEDDLTRTWETLLQRSVGAHGITRHTLDAQWSDLPSERLMSARAEDLNRRVLGFDHVGSRWLVLSDGGVTDPVRRGRMARWVQGLLHRQHEVIFMAPVPVAVLPCLPRGASVAPWRGGALQTGRGHAVALAPEVFDTDTVGQVLALVRMLGQVSTLLLRALCELLSTRATVEGLEWQVWNHPHLHRQRDHASLRPEHHPLHLTRLQTLPAALLLKALDLQRVLHWRRPEADLHLVLAQAARLATQLQPALAQQVAAAWQFFEQMAQQCQTTQGEQHTAVAGQGLRLLDKMPTELRREHRGTLRRLAGAALRECWVQGEAVPHWEELGTLLPPATPNLSAQEDAVDWWLSLGQDGLRFSQQPRHAVGLPGVELWPEPLGPLAPSEGVVLAQQRQSKWSGPLVATQHLLPLSELALGAVDLGLSRHTVRVEQVARPHWAESFAQTQHGLQAVIPLPNGQAIAIDPASQHEKNLFGAEHDLGFRWALCLDKHGPRLELSLTVRETEHWLSMRPLTLRYIPPGTFLMGSPEGVGDDDEHPQHPVTLTEGFWLADTPCTQAQWQAVMGRNPSHFKDGPEAPNRPVELVDVDDVEAFLDRLGDMLPEGCEAVLPTEAQWEYAARAGTGTVYWWGDEQDDSRANWSGQHNGTTPVDRYPPNPWGLYDMHGNVWEWCADAQRDYKERAERDPKGSTGGDARVVRGGSWLDHPDFARSAYRLWLLRGLRSPYQGFRLALRSSSPAPGGPSAERAVGPEAQPATQRGGAPGGRATGAERPGTGGAPRQGGKTHR